MANNQASISEICVNCRYFVEGQTVNSEGSCRLNPPYLIYVHEKGGCVSKFPQVDPEDWCGSWVLDPTYIL